MASEVKGRLSLEFILDSGAARSVLLNAAEGRDRAFDQGKRGLLIPGASTIYAGSQDFAAPNVAQFNPNLIGRLFGLHVQGILGADFLTTHDVLIDYGAQRVFLSRAQDGRQTDVNAARWILVGASAVGNEPRTNGVLNQHRLLDAIQSARVPIALRGRRAYINARLAESAIGPWPMRLDTWATRSTVSLDVASGLKKTGRFEHVSTAGSTFSAEQIEALIAIAADVNLTLTPLATDATESVLGSDAFQGHTILLQFGRAQFRLWPESVMAAFSSAADEQ